MSKKIDQTQISNDGLRYKQRAAGSPFGSHSNSNAVRSCFLCGSHKPMNEGCTRKMAGRHQFVCFGCKPAKPAAADHEHLGLQAQIQPT